MEILLRPLQLPLARLRLPAAAGLEAWLHGRTHLQAFGLACLENALLLLLAVGLAERLERRWGPRPPQAESAGRLANRLALATVGINAGVTWAGWALWQRGWIRFRSGSGLESFGDALVLLLLMDGAMYALHRLAHHPRIYAAIHGLHHRYEAPRPLTLFVMHPAEVLGFGGLWLAVIALRPPTWGGMVLYLALNVAFGVAGHMRRDPLRIPTALEAWLGTAAFHGAHHRSPEANFGFYTRVWDRLFGSYRPPQYTEDR